MAYGGDEIANGIRRRWPQGGDKWHLDEMVVTIAGKKHYLWRAVDQDGFVLDALVQNRRDKKAAKRLLRKLLKKQGRAPRVMVTDKLRSYGAAKKEIMPGVEHRQHKGLNNQLTPANPPTRTPDEAVQVGPPRSALRLDPRPHRQPLPLSPQPTHRRRLPYRPRPSLRGLGRDLRRPPGRLILGPGLRQRHHTAPLRSEPIKLTVP